ncbi:phospholipase D-like domain-containing protein [Micromonospora polyrhachis]|uniref:phospholipase D n=1 Tax=Micromonospora polyrhachis TaxID=1282883 RepID=A0A7W7SQS1_9ACTN|nr:phospholipase D-like domain-containing protein [Micromonospora polyrhachis]MBB4958841.1 phosphatidylserine/phosphatidylglycerophosphate/cardiolipin synthase-like enzyme [Micromonospora polyrhachis]
MRRTVRFGLAGLLAAAVVTGLLAGAPVAAQAATPVTGAVFNNPKGTTAQKYAIVNRIRELIQGSPSGSTIRVAIYNTTDQNITADLVAALDRGVNVRVVVDADRADETAAATLISELGTNRANPSWVVVCTAGRACIGNLNTPIMHNKFFLFSSTLGASNVLVQSSANLNWSNSERYWNNAVQLVGHNEIYNSYVSYHTDLAAKVKNNDYYRTKSVGSVKSYFFPRAGSGASSDTIANALSENVTCTGNTNTGTGTGRTMIRIAMWSITRVEVANVLRALANQKCWVDIVYAESTPEVLAALRHDRIMVYKLNNADGYLVHSKYMAIEGTYAGVRDTKLVFTGSHNWSYSALRENDEALLRITSNSIHDAYRSNFWSLRTAAGG